MATEAIHWLAESRLRKHADLWHVNCAVADLECWLPAKTGMHKRVMHTLTFIFDGNSFTVFYGAILLHRPPLSYGVKPHPKGVLHSCVKHE